MYSASVEEILTTVKIAGNILTLLVNTGDSSSVTVAIWGTILSQLGLYPLLSATISFFRKWFPPLIRVTFV
jgi:hypothetical protein